jgi:hypothetical protein
MIVHEEALDEVVFASYGAQLDAVLVAAFPVYATVGAHFDKYLSKGMLILQVEG